MLANATNHAHSEHEHSLLRFLQNSHALCEAVLEALPLAIVVFDENLKIARANHQAKQMFVGQQKVMGEKLGELVQAFSNLNRSQLPNEPTTTPMNLDGWQIGFLMQLEDRRYFIAINAASSL